MASRRPVYLNAKFLSAAPTGVHRVAAEYIRHLDAALNDAEAQSWRLLAPRDATWPLPLRRIGRRTVGRLTWQAWEQIALPQAAAGGLLVSLCNAAPLTVRGGVVLIHDAHVFDTPKSHSMAFNRWYRFLLPRVARNADVVVTPSRHSRDALIRHGLAPAGKIEVIANGGDHLLAKSSDPSILERLGLQRGRYVLAQANAQAHKNIPMLVDVFNRPELAGIVLCLVGQDEIGGGPNVRNAGYVSDESLRALYEGAAALAFPSLTEGFGLPPLEAMGLGCPVIAAPRGALAETCGSAAVFVDPFDREGWARAILEMTDDSQARASRVAAGRAQAAKFRWAESAGRLRRVIDRLADQAASRSP